MEAVVHPSKGGQDSGDTSLPLHRLFASPQALRLTTGSSLHISFRYIWLLLCFLHFSDIFSMISLTGVSRPTSFNGWLQQCSSFTLVRSPNSSSNRVGLCSDVSFFVKKSCPMDHGYPDECHHLIHVYLSQLGVFNFHNCEAI